MRIIELELSNFKVFGEPTKIPIRPITLIFGPNSSGKSSVIQSLLLMKQTVMSEGLDGNSLVFRGSSTDLGNYSELVHDHDLSKAVSIGVTLQFSDETPALKVFTDETGLEAKSAEITLDTTFVAGTNSRDGIVHSISTQIGDERLVFERPNSVTDSKSASEPSATSPSMLLSSTLSKGEELYELIVEPLVRLAITKLEPELTKLREEYVTAPDPVPTDEEKSKVGKPVFIRFRRRTKEHIEQEINSMTHLLSMLTSYDLETFKLDFKSAIGRVRVGLRGCILDRSLLEDNNNDILYPNLKREAGKSPFYTDKFKEILADELFDLDEGVFDWDGIHSSYYGPKYLSLTSIWLLSLALTGSEIYRQLLQRLIYIGPLREFPLRYYIPETVPSGSVGKTGEFSPTLLFERPNLLASVNEWMERLGFDYRLHVGRLTAMKTDLEEGVFALRLRKHDEEISASLVDVGFGVSQVLPIVTQCLLSIGSTICIEQPEIHLHPALQAELGDLFIESALGNRNNTLILETHSEHMILRILRRIRETNAKKGDLAPRITLDDVSLLYVDRTDTGATILPLRIDQHGRILDRVPGGFFEEGFKELF